MKKTALVTGSSRGLGQAIALRLAQDGYHLILHGQNQSQPLDSILKVIQKIDSEVTSVIFDVANEAFATQALQQLFQSDRNIDILVNNAGISRDKPFLKMTESEWDQVIKTNLYGAFNVTKALLPMMVQNRFGRIINISSIAGQRGAYGKTNYAAAKAGLIGFTKSLSLEVAKSGITVNAICPAWVNTGLSLNIPKKYQKLSLANVAIGRMAEASEIADLVAFLASEKSTYITGAVLDINGGMS